MDSQLKAVKTSFMILCVAGAFAILSSTMAKGPALNPLSKSLGTPDEWSGFVSSASTIPGILISLPAASLSDVLGRKRFLFFAVFVFASAPFLYLLITAWWQLILVRFYHGFATATFVPVAEASIAELYPSKKGERISLFTSATYIGRLAAPLLGSYILVMTNSGLPYRNFHELYLAVSVAGVTAFVAALPFLAGKRHQTPEPRKEARPVFRQMFHGWRAVVRNRGALLVSLVQAGQYYAYGAFEFYLTGYLTSLGYSLLIPGFVATCIILVAVFVRPYMGRVSDRFGRRIPIVLGSVVSAAPLFVIPLVTDFRVLILLAVVYGFGFATVTASTSPLISELVPREIVGTSMGFLAATMDVGQTIGPIVSGFILATSLQYAGVFPSLALVVLGSAAVFALSGVAKRKTGGDSQR